MCKMNITPDFVFQQAYSDQIAARVNRRFWPREHGTPFETSSAHIGLFPPDHREILTATFQGRLIKCKLTRRTDQPTHKHLRGKISDFSAQSRGRLFDLFARLNLRQPVTFITLTYLSEDNTCETAKAHLRAFIKRLYRRFPGHRMSYVWRMEFQTRGAIHFHVLGFGLPFIPKEWVQAAWGEIICEIRPFTRVELIYSKKKITNYVSKYIAKVNPSGISGFNPLTYLAAYQAKHGSEIGRCWGIIGKSALPFAEIVVYELHNRMLDFLRFRDYACREFPPLAQSLSLGFRLYVASAEAWERLVASIWLAPARGRPA